MSNYFIKLKPEFTYTRYQIYRRDKMFFGLTSYDSLIEGFQTYEEAEAFVEDLKEEERNMEFKNKYPEELV